MGDYLNTIREQVGRVWENLSIQNRILFVAAPSLVLIMLLVTIFMVSQPTMVTLVESSDMAYLADIRTYLQSGNFEFDISEDGRTITVSSKDRPNIRMSLAQEGLAGAAEGPGYTLFDTTRLGMTDRIFSIQQKRAIEDELARTIRIGTKYEGVRVSISMPQTTLFKEDEVAPTASVKINSRRAPSQKEVIGIQQIVANAVPNLDPENVVVLDSSNTPLAGAQGEKNELIAEASTHIDVQRRLENDVLQKLNTALAKYLGPDDYKVILNLELDWGERDGRDRSNLPRKPGGHFGQKLYRREQEHGHRRRARRRQQRSRHGNRRVGSGFAWDDDRGCHRQLRLFPK